MNVHYKSSNKSQNNNKLTPWETQNDPFEHDNDFISKFFDKKPPRSNLEN